MSEPGERQGFVTKPGTVLVSGATGRMGGFVVNALLDAGVSVRALTRVPEQADLPAEVEVVAGDFTQADSLESVLAGVESVFLLWTAPMNAAPAVVEQLAASPRHVVYLSAPLRTPHPFFQQPNSMAQAHAEMEALLSNAGLDLTIIRPGMFASNAQFWWGPSIAAGQAVRWPFGAVETAPIDERDVGEVAARLLLGGPRGGDHVLTGPEPISQARQVQVIGEVLERAIDFVDLSPDQFRQETAQSWPAPVVDMLLNAWAASEGHPAYVTSSVQEILGRPARNFRAWVRDHRDDFLPA